MKAMFPLLMALCLILLVISSTANMRRVRRSSRGRRKFNGYTITCTADTTMVHRAKSIWQ